MRTQETSRDKDVTAGLPAGPDGHRVTIRKCKIKRGRIVPFGDPQTVGMPEAIRLLSPSKSSRGIANIVRARSGQYIGVQADGSNFLLINPSDNGDIRWLIDKRPSFESDVQVIYIVDDVDIVRSTVDLPATNNVGS